MVVNNVTVKSFIDRNIIETNSLDIIKHPFGGMTLLLGFDLEESTVNDPVSFSRWAIEKMPFIKVLENQIVSLKKEKEGLEKDFAAYRKAVQDLGIAIKKTEATESLDNKNELV